MAEKTLSPWIGASTILPLYNAAASLGKSHNLSFQPRSTVLQIAKNSKGVVLAATIVLVCFYFVSYARVFPRFSAGYSLVSSGGHGVQSNPIYNATLGFEAIYSLVLPNNPERLAPLLSAVNGTDLALTLVEMKRDEDVVQEEASITSRSEAQQPQQGQLANTFSHMMTWQHIVRESVASALIIEPGVDWDMRVRTSMAGLAQGIKILTDISPDDSASTGSRLTPSSLPTLRSKRILESERNKVPPVPYGDNWDILWVGHCGSNFNGDPRTRYSAYADAAAPSDKYTFAPTPGPDQQRYPRPHNFTHQSYSTLTDSSPNNQSATNWTASRFVFEPTQVDCSSAYAISLLGAQKLLHHFATSSGPLDKELLDHCKHDDSLTCLSVWPQIFSPTSTGSQTEALAGKGIQVSARRNGDSSRWDLPKETWTWEWPDDTQDAAEGDAETARIKAIFGTDFRGKGRKGRKPSSTGG